MRKILKFKILLFTVAGVAGCVSPEQFETTPVQLETSKGIVVCQLYTKDRVLWDRSIGRPQTMSVEEADAICKQEGHRQMTGG
ncbi:hypothetical protein [Leisingera sp. F5]|uniref:hypothetical protein n=1 Tax=Leisingera sp. F5 TaxID=1813816 RepID=UPI0025C52780|nr:hypothetical protein [Leisingera sp. F5]